MNPDIPLPHCARCGSTLLLCTCSGVPWGQDVVYPVEPRLPEDATPQQRMERWALHVSLNPAACAFQGAQFVRDMQQQKGIVEAFARLRPRLEAMAEAYCNDADGVVVAWRLLKEQPGMSRLTKAQSQADVRTAAQRYITFDWSRLHQLGLIMVNNTLAHSEEEAEPDPDLRLGYDVLSCLTTVSKLASKSGAYCFEPFVWQHE